MKKIFSFIIIVLIISNLVACGKENENNLKTQSSGSDLEKSTEEVNEPTSEADSSTSGHAKKILIAYFSRAGENYNVGTIEKGNTQIVAEMISVQTGGTLFQIQTQEPYPEDYDECTEIAEKEKDENARPELVDEMENMDDYDVIFLGYPIWWGDMPMAVYSFLESYDFSGKTIVPFCTHEGSGLADTEDSISKICSNATVLSGLAIRGKTAQESQTEATEAVKKWIADNKITDIAKQNGGQMKITLDNQEFVVNTDQNKTVEDILKSLPIELTMKRYEEHEFYSELPFIPVFDKERTSNIKAGHVYYWDGWNAFVINYIDYDISPYQVVHIGEITDKKIIDVLKNAPSDISISVNK